MRGASRVPSRMHSSSRLRARTACGIRTNIFAKAVKRAAAKVKTAHVRVNRTRTYLSGRRGKFTYDMRLTPAQQKRLKELGRAGEGVAAAAFGASTK